MSDSSGSRAPERDLLVVDTSGLYALLDGDDPRHEATAAAMDAERGPFYLSPFVLQEVDYLVSERLGRTRSLTVLDRVAHGEYRLEPFAPMDVALATATLRRYADLGIGLADASIVVLAARHGTDRVLTLDERHFRVIRPLQGGTFTILPADAPA